MTGAAPRPVHPVGVRAVLDVVRIRARLRLAWLSLLQESDPVRVWLDDLDDPEREAAWRRDTPELAPWREALAEAEGRRGLEGPPVREAFELSAAEADVFDLVLAATVDPSVRVACGRLLGSERPSWPTLDLAARLFEHGRTVLVSRQDPIFAWDLVQLDPARGLLTMEPALARWASAGPEDRATRAAPSELLAEVCRAIEPRPPLQGWPVDAIADQVRALRGAGAPLVLVRVRGPRGAGRRTFCAAVAARLGWSAAAVDLGGVAPAELPRIRVHVQRRARLDGVVPVWVGATGWPPHPAPFPLQFVIDGPGEHPTSPQDVPRIDVDLPLPAAAERGALWRSLAPGAAAWPDAAVSALAATHRVTVGDVQRTAWLAPAGPEEAAACVRAAMRGELGELAERLPATFEWDDLVVPEFLERSLRDLVHEARARNELWEHPELARLFPQGRALVALFTGPPGTGKTMSAQIVARSLGLDLFRIDLSALVSKYIGETSKNLERVLSTAERLDVVLLFDEADALFGKRTDIRDAHDRYANTDTNYLLQAIESWPGIALLASNKRGNIDEAFVRRLRHIIDFPAPDAALRLQLWRRSLARLDASVPDELVARLASSVSLSGAQIKNAVLTAVVCGHRDGAGITPEHLVEGVDRELMKIGRGFSRAERGRLDHHGAR